MPARLELGETGGCYECRWRESGQDSFRLVQVELEDGFSEPRQRPTTSSKCFAIPWSTMNDSTTNYKA
jgi:hypothetical protein